MFCNSLILIEITYRSFSIDLTLYSNVFCNSFGHLGFKWTLQYRSQLFFVTFWVTLLAWILLAASSCSMSMHGSIVKVLPFFQGTIDIATNPDIPLSKMSFYAGLNIIAFDNCEYDNTSTACLSNTLDWSDDLCGQYFDNCDKCEDASTQATVTVLIALITQFFQLMGNLQRSHGKRY